MFSVCVGIKIEPFDHFNENEIIMKLHQNVIFFNSAKSELVDLAFRADVFTPGHSEPGRTGNGTWVFHIPCLSPNSSPLVRRDLIQYKNQHQQMLTKHSSTN